MHSSLAPVLAISLALCACGGSVDDERVAGDASPDGAADVVDVALDDTFTVEVRDTSRDDSILEVDADVGAEEEAEAEVIADADADGADTDSCADGATLCSGACVDTKTDPSNCGGCGTKCCAGSVCLGGGCALECPAGDTACTDPSTGCARCADLATDPTNCGACGRACAPGKICVAGACS